MLVYLRNVSVYLRNVSVYLRNVSVYLRNVSVYVRNVNAQNTIRAATLIKKLEMKVSIAPSHSTLTPGQSVPSLSL